MSKRQSQESRIIEWFETAPIASVAIVMGIVREKVRIRQLADVGVVSVRRAVRSDKGSKRSKLAKAEQAGKVAIGGTVFPHGASVGGAQ